jgi:eukaryotic-like serine/threonine-protein kinase
MAALTARAKSVFLAASDLVDPAERAAYLERECGGNAELLDRVNALLRANDASPLPPPGPGDLTLAQSPDSRPQMEDYADPPARVGSVIAGKYKLVQEIGDGGMGTVYMAQQTEPVKRAVAVKVIKAGMDSKAVLARFGAERQALAIMDHPNIARVLDAGTTDSGRPFFVMELVNGVPITRFCDDRKLTPRQRLELFLPVCQAIQHAHQKGVIHRDIKPSNVLVALYDPGAPGVPKVIDFGVAKAAGQPLTDRTLLTGFGTLVGTPEYMSPEQASFNQMDVDTRSDVYALGVLLYELLTGTTPIDRKSLGNAALLEILRVVREVEAPLASAKLSTVDALPAVAANRGTDPAKLTKLIRGEVDWILLKALEKDRSRRYDTANGLARDIERYLADDVVEARPPSAGYRLKKFVRRHKAQVFAASLVLLALMAGVAAVLAVQSAANARLSESLTRETVANAALAAANAELSRSKAAVQARYELAVEAIKTFHTGVSEDFLLKEEKFKELRDRLLNKASDFYGKLGALLGKETDFAARRALAESNFELAELTRKVGRSEAALAAHRAVLEAREALAAEPGAGIGAKAAVGRSMAAVAYLLKWTGKSDDALVAYLKSESLLAGLAGSDPSARAALAACRTRMARLFLDAGKPAEALEACKRARTDQEALAAVAGASNDGRRDLADTFNELGIVLWQTGKPAEAEREFRAAIAIQQKLASENPAVSEFRHFLANSRAHLGQVLSRIGRQADAEAETRTATALDQKLVDNNPAVTVFGRNLATCRTELGLLLSLKGRPSEAEAELHTALSIIQKLADDNPVVTDFRCVEAVVQNYLGVLLSYMGKQAEAEAQCRTAVAILQKLADESPAVTLFRERLAYALNGLGDAVRSLGRSAEAKDLYERAIALEDSRGQHDPATAELRYFLVCSLRRRGMALRDLGDPASAAAAVRRALGFCDGPPPRSAWEMYEPEMAFCHAALAGLAGQFASGVSAAEGEIEAATAMEWLGRAVAIGYRNASQVRFESALDPLRSRDDFRALAMDLAFPAEPFAR